MIALLSPAKNMNFSQGPLEAQDGAPIFIDDANYLAGKMKKLSARQIGKLMSLSDELSELNVQRYKVWNELSNDQREAIFAFNGEVYRGLNAGEFSKEELNFAQSHLMIISGLYGLLKPLNVIQPYRLEMGCRLKITAKKDNLYKYWGDRITHQLNDTLSEHKSKVILNLASNEYSKAINRKKLIYPIIDFHFLDWKQGEFKAVMTWAKNARGVMANGLIKNQIDDLDSIKKLAFNNYAFNKTLSSEYSYVYSRK